MHKIERKKKQEEKIFFSVCTIVFMADDRWHKKTIAQLN